MKVDEKHTINKAEKPSVEEMTEQRREIDESREETASQPFWTRNSTWWAIGILIAVGIFVLVWLWD